MRALLGLRSIIPKACATPFGQLPDSVLLQILRDGCDEDARQAAYKSCRDIRDFCNRHMKSVTVEIQTAGSLRAVKERSSKTVCPSGACSLEKLTLHFVKNACRRNEEAHNFHCAFKYLNYLIDVTFTSHDTDVQCRRKQLANISSVRLQMIDHPFRMPFRGQVVLSRFISQLSSLQNLHTNSNFPLPGMAVPQLQEVICKQNYDYCITPLALRWLANRNPGIRRLEFVMHHKSCFESFQPGLLRFTTLTHLCVDWLSYIGLLPAGSLLALTSLTTLELHHFEIQDAHLLTQLHITHLTLGSICVEPSNQEQQQQPAQWPALKSIHFVYSRYPEIEFTETTARALLPLPHPGLTVKWLRGQMEYVADVAPDVRYGYVGVAHMGAVTRVCLCGEHVEAVLRNMVANHVLVSYLTVWRESYFYEYVTPRLQLGSDDVGAFLAFPAVMYMSLEVLETGTPELYRNIFLQCPMLADLTLHDVSLPQGAEMDTYLSPIGVEWNFSGYSLTMTRSNKGSA